MEVAQLVSEGVVLCMAVDSVSVGGGEFRSLLCHHLDLDSIFLKIYLLQKLSLSPSYDKNSWDFLSSASLIIK